MEIASISAADLTNLQSQGYTEQDLSMLAPSEVQALLAAPADDGKEPGTADHDAALAAQDAAAATPPADAALVDDAQPADAAPAPIAPQYTVEVPADAKEKIAALKAEDAAAFKRLMDGEIDAEEYQAIKERVEGSVDELKTATLQAEIFRKANEQNAEAAARSQWQAAETAAMATFKAEGLDYKSRPSLLAAYNHNLKALGADPKNERRDASWFLTEAHRLTKEDLGFTSVRKNTPNSVDASELPPTLRSVPVAATGAVNGDEFAHMRNLDGLELERAHARLTPEQRDRWMAE